MHLNRSCFLQKHRSFVLSIILFSGFMVPIHAKPTIRDDFFSVYPTAVGTQLDTLPSNSKHCGICHWDFNGGGPKTPYGDALKALGVSSKDDIQGNISLLGPLDSDSDGFTNLLEITGTGLGYTNIPTFPGISENTASNAVNIPLSEISGYLTPSTATDGTPPEVHVTTPDGGEVVVANTGTIVTWTATDESGIVDVRIYVSLDNGSTFKTVATGLSNSGSYTWFPANRPTSSALIKVEAVDAFTNSNDDVSDAVFTIASPPGGLVSTTLRDFDMPGSQPFEGGLEASDPENCAVCHGSYNNSTEPYYNWRGSMMSMASLDPLFEANMVIANQDAPDSGDLCLRCHLSNGWLQGRSVPTDGSAMEQDDHMGVSCDLCHRMVDPVYKDGISPLRDLEVMDGLSFPFPGGQGELGNGMFIIDPSGIQRGPFNDVSPGHFWTHSPFHKSSAICGTCHDVSNPVFTRDQNGTYQLNTLDSPSDDFSAQSMGPVERTYSEWLNSSYNTPLGIYAPEFAGNKPGGMVSSCQDCHMRDVAGYGANPTTNPQALFRDNLPLHDMTGGSTWLPPIIAGLYPEEVNATMAQAGAERARSMLEKAATLSNIQDVGDLVVRVTNETGHKLPTGYPEGRRIWLNVRFFDGTGTLIGESGAYNSDTGVLSVDPESRIYAVHPGMDSTVASAVGLDPGASLHFVLNNVVIEDNRIPPRGFTNAAFEAFGGAPVGHHYEDGQHWDDVAYTVPDGAVRADVNLYYQSTSKEFIEFLRDENHTNSKGQEMYDLWEQNNRCPPTLMESASYELLPPDLDSDGDGFSNIMEAALGSDPRDISSMNPPIGLTIALDADVFPAIGYTRSKLLSGYKIVVETSTDLTQWSPAAPEEIVEHSVIDHGDGTEFVMVRLTSPLGSEQKIFIRLNVQQL